MAFGDIIQRAEGSNSGASLAVAFGSTPVAGNLLIAVHMTGAAASDQVASGGNNWTSGFHWQNATESDAIRLWWRIAGAGEATSVTATPSASDENGVLLIEIEGPWETSPVDQTTNPGRQATGTTYNCGTTGTLSQADEVAVACYYTRDAGNGGDNQTSWSASFVHDGGLSNTASAAKSVACATKLLAATTAVTTTATHPTSTVSMGGIVTFKKQAAGGGGGPVGSSSQTARSAPPRAAMPQLMAQQSLALIAPPPPVLMGQACL